MQFVLIPVLSRQAAPLFWLPMQNFYELLGARPGDDAETIKKAYRKAAKASHPDHHGGDPAAAVRFREIAEAYEVLSDAEQRADYDELLEAERRPLRHQLRQSLSRIKRPPGYDLAIAAVLTIVLIAGYRFYDRIPDLGNDWAARITARQPAPAAEPQMPHVAATPQMPLLALPTAAQATAPATAAGQAEAISGEPSSPPAEPEIAVASRPGEPDVPVDIGIAAKPDDGPPAGHEMASLGSPPSVLEERGNPAVDNGPAGKAPAQAPGAANGGGVKMPETVMPRAAAKRHVLGGVPGRPPTRQAAFEAVHQAAAAPAAPQPPAPQPAAAAVGPAPDSAPARVLGVGF